jgi:predicted RNase H-like nuclease
MAEARATSIATDASGVTGRIVGVDLAWSTEKNGSGLAFGDLDPDGLTVSEVIGGVVGLNQVQSLILENGPLRGVAIDAPLIIENETGARPCELALSNAYGSRWAGCHASNQTRYPNAPSVRLSRWLASNGFRHLGQENRWQIEVYPHPALIEIFGLEKRLAYKKGTLAQRRAGQVRLTGLLTSLATDRKLPMKISGAIADRFTADYVRALPAGCLKTNEDMLDAVVCCYIGARFALGMTHRIFGTTSTGYIVVPVGGEISIAAE